MNNVNVFAAVFLCLTVLTACELQPVPELPSRRPMLPNRQGPLPPQQTHRKPSRSPYLQQRLPRKAETSPARESGALPKAKKRLT